MKGPEQLIILVITLIPSAVCHTQPAPVLEQQQMDLTGHDFQSVLDMSSLLKLNTAGDHMKDDREGKAQGCCMLL